MARLTEAQFQAAWLASGCSPSAMAAATGMAERSIYDRRARMAGNGNVLHTSPVTETGLGTPVRRWTPLMAQPAQRMNVELADGVVIVFSDAHYWPGLVSVAHSRCWCSSSG
jgi:hypothetical protein